MLIYWMGCNSILSYVFSYFGGFLKKKEIHLSQKFILFLHQQLKFSPFHITNEYSYFIQFKKIMFMTCYNLLYINSESFFSLRYVYYMMIVRKTGTTNVKKDCLVNFHNI